MAFEDRTLQCVECGQDFIFTADEQSRYAERGFTNEPKRCRDCRDKRKAQGGGQGGGRSRSGGGGQGGGGGFGGDRAPRESYEAVCAECGVPTTVPFKPTQGRPVYCRDCFRSKRAPRMR